MIGNLYIITNTVTDKVYVGKCYYSLRERWTEHRCKAKRYKQGRIPHKMKLYEAMNEYGFDKFTIQLIGRFKQGLLEVKEVEYIYKFDSYYNGYNSTMGGDCPSVATIGKEMDVIRLYCVEKLPILAIKERIGLSEHTIRTILYSRYIFTDNINKTRPKGSN